MIRPVARFQLFRCGLLALLLMLAACAGVGTPASSPERSGPFAYASRLDDPQAKAYYHFALAIMRHNQGDLEGVIAALEATLRDDPRTPGLRLYLAEVLLQLGRDDEASRHLEDVLLEDPDSIPAHRMLGEVLLDKGLASQAAFNFRRLTELLPEDEEAVLLYVQALSRSGESILAIDTLKAFVARRPQSYRSHYALARIYRQIDLNLSAVQAYRKVIELQPHLLPVYAELGGLYEARNQPGDLDQAAEVYRAGLVQRPGDSTLRHRLVTVLLRMDRLDAARGELEVLLRDNPDDPEALRKYGLLLMEREAWPEAARTFEHLLTLDTDRVTVRYYLGNVYEKTLQPYEALREFLQIPPEAELYPDARIHAAYLYRMLGELEAAYQALLPLLEDPRASVEQVLLTAALAIEGGFSSEALQVFQQGEKRFPGNTRLIYQRGTLLEKLGMQDAARAAMREILKLDPDHAEALNFIAYQFAEAGTRLDEALELATRAIALNEAGHIYDTLGWVYYRLGRYQESLKALQAARREIADDPVIFTHLGDVLVALKEYSRAREAYRQALELAPGDPDLQRKLEALP